ncbi:urease accessory protein UreD [Cetobacterium somerae]|uniref:Urease accessory protein UreD n=3 Tax=Cetobacterium TaxID=180162 RepID=U7VA17_9FUSO|nr:urease accessory protein UreD [Cetobacterium somerae]ERT67984.1 urease accessory protein UreD [Cetobacterium somerae ATCC BAA-474]
MDRCDGKLEIVLENHNLRNETIIKKIYHEGVFKVSPTIHLDNEKVPCYFLMHMGGGYLEGEHCYNDIHLKENTRSIITTQTPTIIYKCLNNIPAKQFSKIRLEKNSVLEYIMDNTILFKDANFEQETDIYLDSTSTLILAEGITAGWSSDGKPFQYKLAKMKNRIYLDDKLVLLDKLLLSPEKSDLFSMGHFENYLNYGTAIIIDSKIDLDFVENMRIYLQEYDVDVKYGVSKLEIPGVVVRALGNLTQDIQKIIYGATNYSREKLLGSCKLDLRKQ